MNKTLNAICGCGSYISSQKNNIMMLPCEHIIHFSCLKMIRKSKCPMCKEKVNKFFTYKEIQYIWRRTKSKKFYQRYIDMACIKYIWDTGNIDPLKAFAKLPFVSFKASEFINTNDLKKIPNMIEDIIRLANIKIIVRGRQNVKNVPRVIISNHSMELDALIIGYIFRCGFVGSSIIKDNWYGQKLSEITPIVIVERGKKGNTVNKMKEFLNKEKKPLCIFPEGFITHQKTIARFRTGAFNCGYPVQPIVIRYKPSINDDNPVFLFAKLFSQNKITVLIDILEMEYPPFTHEKIEHIRNKMGKVGNMTLSRVSNRDIIDVNP